MDNKDFKVDLNNEVLNDYWKKWQSKQPKKDKPDKTVELPQGYVDYDDIASRMWPTDLPKSKL